MAPLVPDVHQADLETYAQRLYDVTEGMEREQAGALFFTFVQERYEKYFDWPQIRQRVEQMLRKVGFGMDIIDEMILKTDIAQNAIERAATEAAAQATKQATKQARLEVKIEDVCRLWRRKFGEATLTPSITTALEGANITLLDRILEQMVDPSYNIAQAQTDLAL